MLSMMIFYDRDGNVTGTLNHMVAFEDGRAVGLVDFAEHEAAGGEMRDIADMYDPDGSPPGPDAPRFLPPDDPWRIVHDRTAGSGSWPEWLDIRVHGFRVELEPGWSRHAPRGQRSPARIKALVHRESGHRRERADIESAIQQRISEAAGAPADISDIVGGPDRPVPIDNQGRDLPRVKPTRSALPVVRSQPAREDKMPGNRNDRAE